MPGQLPSTRSHRDHDAARDPGHRSQDGDLPDRGGQADRSGRERSAQVAAGREPTCCTPTSAASPPRRVWRFCSTQPTTPPPPSPRLPAARSPTGSTRAWCSVPAPQPMPSATCCSRSPRTTGQCFSSRSGSRASASASPRPRNPPSSPKPCQNTYEATASAFSAASNPSETSAQHSSSACSGPHPTCRRVQLRRGLDARLTHHLQRATPWSIRDELSRVIAVGTRSAPLLRDP